MNILTFNYEYPPLGGGGGVVHALLAEELAQRHRVWVVTSGFKGLASHEVRDGVTIVRVPVLGRHSQATASLPSMLTYPPGAWLAGARLLRRERMDVIHGHFAVPTGPGSIPPAGFARIPHVISIQGGDIYDPSKGLSPHRWAPLRATVRWVLRHSDAVVAASTNIRDNAIARYGYAGPIHLIPLGIKQPAVPKVPRSELGLPSDATVGITVGRLVKRKGLDAMLRALALPACSGVHLVVVGGGPEMASLKRLGNELAISDRLHFQGRVPERRKWELLQAANVYLSTTMHEGFGLVYLEAMAAGLPVVTFDHGGQIDFLADGETGYVVRAGDVDAMAAAIGRIVADRENAIRIGAANRQRAVNHRIEECAGRYEALYADLVARRSER